MNRILGESEILNQNDILIDPEKSAGMNSRCYIPGVYSNRSDSLEQEIKHGWLWFSYRHWTGAVYKQIFLPTISR